MYSLHKTKQKSQNRPEKTEVFISEFVKRSEANKKNMFDSDPVYPVINYRDNNRFNAEHSFDYFSIKAISF